MRRNPDLQGEDDTDRAGRKLSQLASLKPYASDIRPISWAVAVIGMLALIAGLAFSIADDPVPVHVSVYTKISELPFVDPVLRSCVLDEAARNNWTVSGEVRNLTCSGTERPTKVTRLSGIENLVNLGEVDLSGNNIHDTSVLGQLAHLESLDLSSNAIISPELHGLRATLRSLDLDENQITTLEWVRDLPLLESLSVAHNRIISVDALGGLDRLRMLNLAHNEISNVAALVNLPRLEVLDLEANPVRNSASLRKLESLLFIDLKEGGVPLHEIPGPSHPTDTTPPVDVTSKGG